jgi:hypothetical protein
LTVKDTSGTPISAVWKLGDSVYSTPVIVGAPRERYDILYGDSSYTSFYSMYKNRRQVAYLGANDGMMHAFNVGFFHEGDDTVSTPAKVEHGWFDNTSTSDGRGVNIGDELWALFRKNSFRIYVGWPILSYTPCTMSISNPKSRMYGSLLPMPIIQTGGERS